MKKQKVLLVISAVLTAIGIIGLLKRVIWWCRTALQVTTGAASVGIIGGADGPTAIFVTVANYRMPWYGFLILALIGIAALIWSREN